MCQAGIPTTVVLPAFYPNPVSRLRSTELLSGPRFPGFPFALLSLGLLPCLLYIQLEHHLPQEVLPDLIPSRLRRFPSSLSSCTTLSLSWSLLHHILSSVSVSSITLGVPREQACALLMFCTLVPCSLWQSAVLTKCLLNGGRMPGPQSWWPGQDPSIPDSLSSALPTSLQPSPSTRTEPNTFTYEQTRAQELSSLKAAQPTTR